MSYVYQMNVWHQVATLKRTIAKNPMADSMTYFCTCKDKLVYHNNDIDIDVGYGLMSSVQEHH